MLIAEDLLLLLTDDDTGKLVATPAHVDLALGGAVLVDLTMAGNVDLTGPGADKPGRLVVRDPTRPGDPVLADALEVVRDRAGKKPTSVVGPLGKKLRDRLYARLVQYGVLRAEQDKVLGLFPRHTWPTQHAEHEAEVRARLEQVLVQGLTPDPRTAALVALLRALRALPKVVDPRQHGLTKRDLDHRARAIAEGDWAAESVRKAIDEMTAAVTAAIVASTSSTVGSGGG